MRFPNMPTNAVARMMIIIGIAVAIIVVVRFALG